MNFKPLLYNKAWIVYYHYNKRESGSLEVAVQGRHTCGPVTFPVMCLATLVFGFHLQKMTATSLVFTATFQTA